MFKFIEKQINAYVKIIQKFDMFEVPSSSFKIESL